MIKKLILIKIAILFLITCNGVYDKGKKGDFLFRKCTNCQITSN